MSSNPIVERRRSERLSESVPVVIRGVDLLGHSFEERTATVALNLHGCKYYSKYHLPRNSWITLETSRGDERRNVRARVAWIHRPHSIRDLFQVAVELETSADIWGLNAAPVEWQGAPQAHGAYAAAPAEKTNTPGPAAAATRSEGNMHTRGFAASGGNGLENGISAAARLSAASFEQAAAADEDQALQLWRERLNSELALAQRQWDELLQSSMDRALQRLAEQLPERALTFVRATEEKLAQHSSNFGLMMDQMSLDAQNAMSTVKAGIDQELRKARETLETTRSQALDKLAAEAEERVAPHAVRVPQLVQELAGREEQLAESLQLHRERLRHASDNTLRDIGSHVELSVARVRTEFEAARVDAQEKWNRELDSTTARAGHAASEAISRTSEWLEQETRGRIQLMSEQVVTAATAKLEEQTAEATGQFAKHLEGQSLFHLAHVHQQLDGVATDLTGKTRTQLAEAAETAAASFGEVLHDLAARETERFHETGVSAMEERTQEFRNSLRSIQESVESDSTERMDTLRQQAAALLQETLGDARAALSAESQTILGAHRAERDAYVQQWQERLTALADQAFAQCNDRIQTAADAWTLSSVRKLNEHGQNAVESIVRTADQALHSSASRVFEGLAAMLKENQGKNGTANHAAASAVPPDMPAEKMRSQEGYPNQPGA